MHNKSFVQIAYLFYDVEEEEEEMTSEVDGNKFFPGRLALTPCSIPAGRPYLAHITLQRATKYFIFRVRFTERYQIAP